MAKIFLIEDDPEISENVQDWLQSCENHIVDVTGDGACLLHGRISSGERDGLGRPRPIRGTLRGRASCPAVSSCSRTAAPAGRAR